MPTYFIDDAGDNSDGSTWAKAYSSMYAMLNHGTAPHGTAGAPLASGDIVYMGNDTVDAASYSANTTIVGPASGAPVSIISSTVGSGTTASYSKSATRQIDTSNNGANTYTLTFDGSFAVFGILAKSGGNLAFSPDADEGCYSKSLTAVLGANGYLTPAGGFSRANHVDLTIDMTADGTTARTANVFDNFTNCRVEIYGLTFVNAGYRTSSVVGLGSTRTSVFLSGADFSGFTNGTTCELVDASNQNADTVLTNCLTHSTWTPGEAIGTNQNTAHTTTLTNVGPADAPTYLYFRTPHGLCLSSSAIYRTGGATIEGDACSWLITTDVMASPVTSEGLPFYTPWIYGTVASTGSKTFDLYITNDTADFTDAECWLEVEYLGTADEAIWALATDQRATITTTAAAQTDDTTSTWTGSGPSFTYKQRLSVTCTIGETGQYRARVAVGVASIAGSRYFYIDPKVTVS